MRGWSRLAPLPKLLKPYEDLIYTPLAFPDPPSVKFDQFFDWAYGPEPDLYEGLTNQKTSGQFAAMCVEQYPWKIVRCFRNDYKESWAPEFSERFPQLKEYIQSFPIKRLRIAAFLIQRKTVPGFVHCDVDDGIGLRFYLKNTDSCRLVFHKTFKKVWARPLTFEDTEDGPIARDISKIVDLRSPIKAKQPKPVYPWALTATRAMHTVEPVEEQGIKITCSLMPDLDPYQFSMDEVQLKNVLDRSQEAYRDLQIWY